MRVWTFGLLLAGTMLVLSGPRVPGAEDKAESFTPLFNGKDLTGWKEKKGGTSLEGKTEAYKGRFKVHEGVLVIDPKVKGDVRIVTVREFAGDVHVKFEFKPDAKCNNDLFLRGHKFDLVKSGVKNLKQDEWNAFEIIVKDKKITFKNNGEVQRSGAVKSDSSVLEIRAEFGAVAFRRMEVMGGKK